MIAQLLRFALRQRFVVVLVGLTLIGRASGPFQLKIEAYPDISDTQAVVITPFQATRPRKWNSRSRCRSSER